MITNRVTWMRMRRPSITDHPHSAVPCQCPRTSCRSASPDPVGVPESVGVPEPDPEFEPDPDPDPDDDGPVVTVEPTPGVTELVGGSSSGGGGMVAGARFGVGVPGDVDVDGPLVGPDPGQFEPPQKVVVSHWVFSAVVTNALR